MITMRHLTTFDEDEPSHLTLDGQDRQLDMGQLYLFGGISSVSCILLECSSFPSSLFIFTKSEYLEHASPSRLSSSSSQTSCTLSIVRPAMKHFTHHSSMTAHVTFMLSWIPYITNLLAG